MTKCPICNRERTHNCWPWCEDCMNECPNSLVPIAEWAANRAREFEKEKTKVLVAALENIRNLYDEDDNPEDWNHIKYANKALEEYERKE